MARRMKQGTYGKNLTWTLDNKGLLTISGEGKMEKKEDDSSLFGDNLANITKVKISQGVTSIGAFAFGAYSALTSIEIPNSVTEIGGYAFWECHALTSIEIPDSVTTIGEEAFSGCWELANINVSGGNANYVSIDGVMYDKEKKTIIRCPQTKTSIEIPNSVTRIGENAFFGCHALTSITIPNSVTEIGKHAFSGCNALTSIEIPDSVTTIGEFAFDGCEALTSIEIPNSVTSIGRHAFDGCKALTSIEIPDSVTEIGDDAFDGCSALTSINIPDSVTEIGEEAFEGCEALEKVEFASIESLCSISFNGYYSNPLELAPHLYINGQEVTNLIIPNGVTRIGDGAFCGCEALTSIKIPDSVTTIGEEAFSYCTSLMSINVTEDNLNYASIDGVLYNKDKKILIQCPGGKNNIEIPNSVRIIGENAFSGCEALTSITIPNSVTSIGEGAFRGCSALTSIEIPDSVTEIGERAFYGCRCIINVDEKNENYKSKDGNLLSKDGSEILYAYINKDGICGVPEDVKTIKSGCFGGEIKNAYMPATVTTLEEDAFFYVKLESLHMRHEHPEDLRIDEYTFYKTNIENCTLHVPIGTGYAYRHHPVFSYFKEVVIEK